MKNRIKELRNSMNMTTEEFGKAIGVSGSIILRMENNKIVISDKIVAAICHKFNVNYEWIKYGKANNNYISTEYELINCIKEDLIKALLSIDNTLAKQLLTNTTKLLRSKPLNDTEECLLSFKNELESEKKGIISLVLQNIKDTEFESVNKKGSNCSKWGNSLNPAPLLQLEPTIYYSLIIYSCGIRNKPTHQSSFI